MVEATKNAPKKKDTKKTFKSFNPKKFVNTEPKLNEAVKRDTAVISFGRMNPITIGHEKLASKIASTAIKMKGDPLIFLSHTSDSKKNPLSYEDKIKFAQKAFGRMVVKSKARQIIQVAQELEGSYKNLVMVVGQDRIKEFETILNKYNGKEFNFDSIQVISAGQRDPDAEGIEGMSASKMRLLAAQDDFEQFKRGLPKKLQSSAQEVFDAVRNGLGINESLSERVLDNAQRRKMAMSFRKNKAKVKRGKERAARKKAPISKLKSRAQKQALATMKKKFSQGSDGKDMSTAQKNQIAKKLERVPKGRIAKLAKKLLPSVKKKEQERFINRNKSKNEDINEAFELFMEAKKIGSRVTITKGNYKGKTGTVRSIKKGEYGNVSAKKLDIDLDDGDQTVEYTQDVKLLKEASMNDVKPKKRFHMMLNKDHSCKIDKRFKMFKQPTVPYKDGEPQELMGESLDDISLDVITLQESVEDYIAEAPFGADTNFFKKTMPDVESWLDRNVRNKQYRSAMDQYVDFVKQGRKDALVAAAKIWNVDTKTLRKFYDSMVKESINEKFEQFISEKSGAGDEGTDELVKTFKKNTPHSTNKEKNTK